MSDSPAITQSFSFAARDVILNMTLMESLGFGIYTSIFWFTLYRLVFRKRAERIPGGTSAYLIIIPLYILAMVHFSIRWTTARSALVVHGDTADSIVQAFFTQSQWSIALSAISFSLMTLIADYVTVWRCWVVWDRNWKAVILPFLLVLTGTAFCIMALVFQINPSGLSISNLSKFSEFGTVYFALSICSTAICTLAIIYRILAVSKESGFSLIGPYRKVLEITVESAALYTVALIVYLPLLVREDFTAGYAQALLVSITGIAPTVITARVSLGITRNYSTVHSPEPIASTARVTISASQTMFDESLNELGHFDAKKEGGPHSGV